MLRHLPAVLALLTFSVALAARTPGADEAKAIRAVLDAQVAAWNKGDLEGFMAGYWKSPELTFYSGKTKLRGWQATLDRYRKRYQAEGREMGRLRFETVEVLGLGPDAALARGGWRLHTSDGKEPHGLFTLLLRRPDGDWRIVYDHTSAAE